MGEEAKQVAAHLNYDIVIIPESDYMTEDPIVVHELKTSGIRVA